MQKKPENEPFSRQIQFSRFNPFFYFWLYYYKNKVRQIIGNIKNWLKVNKQFSTYFVLWRYSYKKWKPDFLNWLVKQAARKEILLRWSGTAKNWLKVIRKWRFNPQKMQNSQEILISETDFFNCLTPKKGQKGETDLRKTLFLESVGSPSHCLNLPFLYWYSYKKRVRQTFCLLSHCLTLWISFSL